MATGINLLKLTSNMIRSRRLAMMHELSEVYHPAINKRREKLIETIKEKAEIASRSEVAGKLRVLKEYWKVEMAPPSVNEWQKLHMDLALLKEFISSGAWKHLTVKQLWLLFLVGIEVGMWFFLGETFGKMHIVGYKV